MITKPGILGNPKILLKALKVVAPGESVKRCLREQFKGCLRSSGKLFSCAIETITHWKRLRYFSYFRAGRQVEARSSEKGIARLTKGRKAETACSRWILSMLRLRAGR